MAAESTKPKTLDEGGKNIVASWSRCSWHLRLPAQRFYALARACGDAKRIEHHRHRNRQHANGVLHGRRAVLAVPSPPGRHRRPQEGAQRHASDYRHRLHRERRRARCDHAHGGPHYARRCRPGCAHVPYHAAHPSDRRGPLYQADGHPDLGQWRHRRR